MFIFDSDILLRKISTCTNNNRLLIEMIDLKKYEKYRAVVFDFDDTLFDYSKTEQNALMKVCEKMNIEFSDNLYKLFHLINTRLWHEYEKTLVSQSNLLREIRFRELFELLKIEYTDDTITDVSNLFLTESECGVMIDGVEDTLNKIKKLPLLLGIASSGFTHPRVEKLETSSIRSIFDFAMFREDFDIVKPDVGFFRTIQRVCGGNVLYIGDSYESDIVASKKAGFDNIWFDSRNQRINMNKDSHCDCIVTNFSEINTFLQEDLQ